VFGLLTKLSRKRPQSTATDSHCTYDANGEGCMRARGQCFGRLIDVQPSSLLICPGGHLHRSLPLLLEVVCSTVAGSGQEQSPPSKAHSTELQPKLAPQRPLARRRMGHPGAHSRWSSAVIVSAWQVLKMINHSFDNQAFFLFQYCHSPTYTINWGTGEKDVVID
jgi:hypothetical protein